MDTGLETHIEQYLKAVEHYSTLTGFEQRDTFMDVTLLGQTVIMSLLVTIARKEADALES